MGNPNKVPLILGNPHISAEEGRLRLLGVGLDYAGLLLRNLNCVTIMGIYSR